MADGANTFTIKFGTGYEAPWLVLGFDTMQELEQKLDTLHQNPIMIDKMVGIAAIARNKHREAQPEPVRAPQSDQSQQAVQQAPAPQQAPAANPGADTAPRCQCNKEMKMLDYGTSKARWRCEDWRYNDGNPTPNHDQQWVNSFKK